MSSDPDKLIGVLDIGYPAGAAMTVLDRKNQEPSDGYRHG